MVTFEVYKSSHSRYCTLMFVAGPNDFHRGSDLAEILTGVIKAWPNQYSPATVSWGYTQFFGILEQSYSFPNWLVESHPMSLLLSSVFWHPTVDGIQPLLQASEFEKGISGSRSVLEGNYTRWCILDAP